MHFAQRNSSPLIDSYENHSESYRHLDTVRNCLRSDHARNVFPDVLIQNYSHLLQLGSSRLRMDQLHYVCSFYDVHIANCEGCFSVFRKITRIVWSNYTGQSLSGLQYACLVWNWFFDCPDMVQLSSANQIYEYMYIRQYNLLNVVQVIGVGGGGSNVVNRMVEDSFNVVESWVVNTDAQVCPLLKSWSKQHQAVPFLWTTERILQSMPTSTMWRAR